MTGHWSSWRIILLLVIFSVLLVLFLNIQVVKGDAGTLPLRILFQCSVRVGAYFMFFSQQLGGSVFVTVGGQRIFINSLASTLTGVPGLNPLTVVNTGATNLKNQVPAQYLPVVVQAYNHALTRPFVIATAMSAAAILGSFEMEWKSIKKTAKVGAAATAPKTAETYNKKEEETTFS